MRDFFSPTVILFLVLQAVAVGLAAYPPTREEIFSFARDPWLYALQQYDELSSNEYKSLLTEHLPGIFSPSYACQFRKDSVKKAVFAGDRIESGPTGAQLVCTGNLTINLRKDTVVKMHRAPQSEKALEVISGGASVSLG